MVLRAVTAEDKLVDQFPDEDEVMAKEEEWDGSRKNIAVDLGYGFVKLWEGQQSLRFPSVVGIGKELNFLSRFTKLDQPLDNLQLNIEGKSYFVGDLAIRQSDIASRSLDQNRVDDPNAKILLLTALGLISQWDNQSFNLVTGLPPSYYGSYHNDWAREIKGQYSIGLNCNGRFKEKRFAVRDAYIIPQPFGTLYDQMLNSGGNMVNQEFSRMVVGIIDIGYKTTDFAVANNLEFIEHLSSSSTVGMANVHRLMAEYLRRTFNVDKEDYQLDQIVEEGVVRIAGQLQDLTEVRAELFQQVAQKIITEALSRWDYRQYDTILLTGGGGEALAEYILPAFPNIHLVENAQYSNLLGYQKLANSIFDGN